MTIRQLIDTINKNYEKPNIKLVEEAFAFADDAHKGQKRATGDNYIEHCLQTAKTLAELKLPIPMIIAGLLHDVPEDTEKTLDDLRKKFGKDIAQMVEGITKLSNIKYRGIDRYIENLRKMFIAMAQDIRVVLIKFADRLHNLQTLYALPADKQKRIALETIEIYAPIANRLGIGELQSRLEDASFKFAYPDEFILTEQIIKKNFPIKKKNLNNMIRKIKNRLDKEKINFQEVYGRTKHYFSFYRKYIKYDKDISKICDLVALRIIVKNVSDCYAVLGVIHNAWKPMRGRIKDYIAQPKPNGYQSLHTAVFGDDQEIVEIQIRTRKMNEQAELGIAAHWQYKESLSSQREIEWVNELADWLKNVKDNDSFLKGAKIDVFQNRIFVFTPQGDVIDLPEEATPVDFAYHIHSDIGNKCAQATVNSEGAPLDKVLKNGDVVQIVTNKNRKGPNPDWLKFVKTRTAQHHIENFKNKSWKKFIPKISK